MKIGKIKIRANSVIVQVTNRERYSCSDYAITDETLHNKECEFEAEGNKVIKLVIDGKEYPKDTSVLEKKIEKERKKAEEEALERQREEEAKRNKALISTFQNDSFDMERAIYPNDLKQLKVQNYEVDNFNLKYNKFARWNKEERSDRNPFSFFKTFRGKIEYEIKPNFGDFDFDGLSNRSLDQAKELMGIGQYKTLDLSVDWRLVTGLGTASVYETNMSLHHIYGIPFLPASSIKGVLRSWIIQTVFGASAAPGNESKAPLVNAEYRALMDKNFCKVFGCPATANKVEFNQDGQPKEDDKGKYRSRSREVAVKDKDGKGQALQGALIIWDAFPLTWPNLKVDIMNPHYGRYYSKGEAPVDYDSPNPIPFLTVEDTRFRFIIGIKKENWMDFQIAGKTMDYWLEDALKNHGVGAKTAVGYGYFE